MTESFSSSPVILSGAKRSRKIRPFLSGYYGFLRALRLVEMTGEKGGIVVPSAPGKGDPGNLVLRQGGRSSPSPQRKAIIRRSVGAPLHFKRAPHTHSLFSVPAPVSQGGNSYINRLGVRGCHSFGSNNSDLSVGINRYTIRNLYYITVQATHSTSSSFILCSIFTELDLNIAQSTAVGAS